MYWKTYIFLGDNSIDKLVHYPSFFQTLILSHDYIFLCFVLNTLTKSMTMAIHNVNYWYTEIWRVHLLLHYCQYIIHSLSRLMINRIVNYYIIYIVLQWEAQMASLRNHLLLFCTRYTDFRKMLISVVHSKWHVYSAQHSCHCYRSVWLSMNELPVWSKFYPGIHTDDSTGQCHLCKRLLCESDWYNSDSVSLNVTSNPLLWIDRFLMVLLELYWIL